jgi:hypothetical protein
LAGYILFGVYDGYNNNNRRRMQIEIKDEGESKT